ncbi:29202_t:CDS:2, partial [Gigaspora margarita]
METQSNIKIEVQSNVKYCKNCSQDHPLESFNNGKTCLKCRSKKNNQNAQKHAAANVNTGYDPTKHRDRLPMQWFHCNGWLTITVDTKKKQVIVELTHEYHAKYADIRVMDKIKGYIQNNLHQTPWVIWKNLVNISGKKMKIKSAIKIIKVYDNIEIILNITDNEVTMISFGIIEIINKLDVNTVEIGIDTI